MMRLCERDEKGHVVPRGGCEWEVGGEELVVDHTLCSAALSVRSVVYLPPSLLLLHDNLQSMLATSLELNAARLLNVDV